MDRDGNNRNRNRRKKKRNRMKKGEDLNFEKRTNLEN